MTDAPTRRLAAIMFADMVGYTALMQSDEDGARAQRDRHRAIQTAAVAAHHGEILQYYGDGTLSIFPSAVEAVQCAVEIQLQLRDEELIPLRVGVHTGDIVRDQGDIYGDGVNVASRIEGLAAPGGVVISGKVFDEIKNHPSLSTVSLGSVRLKNVERLTDVFAVANEGLSVPTKEYVQAKAEGRSVPPAATALGRSGAAHGGVPTHPTTPAGGLLGSVKEHAGVLVIAFLLAAGAAAVAIVVSGDGSGERPRPQDRPTATAERERPVIAVLPFVNMSAQQEEDAAFLATGLHDELLTQLSKIASLDVIARTSVMQYEDTEKTVSEIGRELGVNTVLEGSLMRAGNQVRLNVQLIDATTDRHLWADTYDRQFTVANVFDIQSDLAEQVVLALQAQVVPAERALIADVPTEDLEAYTLYLQGIAAHARAGWEPRDLETAAEMFVAAIDADPEFALAHAWLSITENFLYLFYDRSEARLARARDTAEEALRLNPELPWGHFAMAFYHFQRYEDDEAAQAIALAEAGLPGSADVVTLKAEQLYRQGQYEASLAARVRAATLDPLNPELAVNLASAYADLGRWNQANAVFDRVSELHPTFFEAAFIRGWLEWRRTGDGEAGLAALAQVPPEVNVFGLKTFFQWVMTEDPEARVAALARIDQPVLDFGGFWWAPRELLEAWTYRRLDPPRAERAYLAAVDVCRAALETAPDDPRIHASLGRAYSGLGRREEAVREAQRVVQILPIAVDPSFGQDLLEITAIIYAELGMADEAADAMEGVLSVPGVPPMVHLLGPEFERVRDHPRIQALIERAAGDREWR
jgi:TolB-like protein/class 3 adenylate cyclase/Tfp pilus assembly protein PilF